MGQAATMYRVGRPLKCKDGINQRSSQETKGNSLHDATTTMLP